MSYSKEQKRRRWILTIFGSKIFSFPKIYKMRIRAYQKHFNIGKNPIIEHNVWITRTHGFKGSISIGNKVLFAKNVTIDYSGELVIKDGVKIASGVTIETHHRDLEAYKQGRDVNIQTKLLIEENAYIGINAIILSSCNYIGKNARVGAGAVVVKDVPDNVTVGGVPAKVIKVND
jgi:acetyltransferase-like isoleucine patch superfamily enzyme